MMMVPTPHVIPSASVRMETCVLCVINVVENVPLTPLRRSSDVLSSRDTRSLGSPCRCENGMMTALAPGSFSSLSKSDSRSAQCRRSLATNFWMSIIMCLNGVMERWSSDTQPNLPPHPVPLPLRGGEGARRAGEGVVHGPEARFWNRGITPILPSSVSYQLPLLDVDILGDELS